MFFMNLVFCMWSMTYILWYRPSCLK